MPLVFLSISSVSFNLKVLEYFLTAASSTVNFHSLNLFGSQGHIIEHTFFPTIFSYSISKLDPCYLHIVDIISVFIIPPAKMLNNPTINSTSPKTEINKANGTAIQGLWNLARAHPRIDMNKINPPKEITMEC